MMSLRAIPSLLVVAVAMTACQGVTPQTEPVPEAATAGAASATSSATPVTTGAASTEGRASAPASAPTVSAPTAVERPSEMSRPVATDARAGRDPRLVLTEMIFFDYDQAELRPEARQVLDAKAAILQGDVAVRIRVAGHTDERGSDEYNIALGMRRAAAAKRYLVGLGIAEDRIAVVSFGAERPVNTASSEAAWAQNRRDEFEIIVGGPAVAPR